MASNAGLRKVVVGALHIDVACAKYDWLALDDFITYLHRQGLHLPHHIHLRIAAPLHTLQYPLVLDVMFSSLVELHL